jgi:hypothetical protein
MRHEQVKRAAGTRLDLGEELEFAKWSKEIAQSILRHSRNLQVFAAS